MIFKQVSRQFPAGNSAKTGLTGGAKVTRNEARGVVPGTSSRLLKLLEARDPCTSNEKGKKVKRSGGRAPTERR